MSRCHASARRAGLGALLGLLLLAALPARAQHAHGAGGGASHHFESEATVRTGLARFRRADAAGHVTALSAALQLAATHRLALGAELPFHWVQLDGGRRLGGPGDVGLGLAGVLVQGARGGALVGRLAGTLPLGERAEGLGMGHVMTSASLEAAWPLRPGWTLSAATGASVMLGSADAHAQHAGVPAYVYPHARREGWLHAGAGWQPRERLGLWLGLETTAVPPEGWRTLGGASLGASLQVRPGAHLQLDARAPLWGERRFGHQLGLGWRQSL